jgi:adenylate kinase
MNPNMTSPQKFSEEDIEAIKQLQSKYQEKFVQFGQLSIERFSVEETIKSLDKTEVLLKEEYLKLQEEESKLIEGLGVKYGDGVLSLKDGTFTSSSK